MITGGYEGLGLRRMKRERREREREKKKKKEERERKKKRKKSESWIKTFDLLLVISSKKENSLNDDKDLLLNPKNQLFKVLSIDQTQIDHQR